MDNIKLYLQFLSMHFKVQLQNRMSFILMLIGQSFIAFTSVFAILVLTHKDQTILGFNQAEILISGAIIMMSFSLAECFGRGFDTFPIILGNGQFDRMLVRPTNLIFQIFSSTADLSRLGRVFIAFCTLIYATQQLEITNYGLLVLTIICGFIVYLCLFIIYGAISFFTTESLEIMNILTDGTREFGKVPFSFYGDKILKFLTFVVPMAAVQYYPLLIILNKPAQSVYALYPVLALLFIIPTIIIWKLGRNHYRSTGS